MLESNKELKSLDDIVFEGRNKEYGAYELRMSEKSTLLKAFIRGFILILVLVFAIYASAAGLFTTEKKKDTIVDVMLTEVSLPETQQEVEEEVVEPEPEPEPEQQENHYQEETAQEKFVMPEPKEAPKKEETIPPKEQLVDKDLSFEKREGKESTGQTGGGPVNLNKEAPVNTTQAPKTEDKAVESGPVTVTARTAAVMAIYPGCEKEATKGKKEATDCLSKKLGADIGDELQDFANDAASEGLSGVVVSKLNFQIDTNGRIVSITPQGDAKLGPEAKKALQRITDRQQKRGKTIKPAQTEDGRPAKLNFSIPVKMAIEN